jgi:hypothetical protein
MNEGINIDWSSINKIMNKNFHIQIFLGTIDSFRCKELYIQIVKKFKLEKTINSDLIEYGRKKKLTNPSRNKENIHFRTLFKSEKIFTLKDNVGYKITIDKEGISIPISNERKSIEKENNFLRRKFDRFRIWKEKFSNIKEITNILDLKITTYTIQLKENNYLLWKFKKK